MQIVKGFHATFAPIARKENALPNPVVHFEVQSSGAEELHKFYADLFEWHIDASNPMGYGVVDTHTEKGINGGISGTDGRPNLVTFYVEVEDIDAKLKEAVERGAKVVMPVTAIPDMVTFATFSDSEGNCVGLVSSEVPG